MTYCFEKISKILNNFFVNLYILKILGRFFQNNLQRLQGFMCETFKTIIYLKF